MTADLTTTRRSPMNIIVCRLIAAANKNNIITVATNETLTILMHHTVVIHSSRITAISTNPETNSITYFWESIADPPLALSTGKLTRFQKKIKKLAYLDALEFILKELESDHQ